MQVHSSINTRTLVVPRIMVHPTSCVVVVDVVVVVVVVVTVVLILGLLLYLGSRSAASVLVQCRWRWRWSNGAPADGVWRSTARQTSSQTTADSIIIIRVSVSSPDVTRRPRSRGVQTAAAVCRPGRQAWPRRRASADATGIVATHRRCGGRTNQRRLCAYVCVCLDWSQAFSAVRIVFFFHFKSNRIVELLFEISNRME